MLSHIVPVTPTMIAPLIVVLTVSSVCQVLCQPSQPTSQAWQYVPPGSHLTFSTLPRFTEPINLVRGKFYTESGAVLTLSCDAILPCSYSADLRVMNVNFELIGLSCTRSKVMTSIPVVKTPYAMTVELSSGFYRGSRYHCRLDSAILQIEVTPDDRTCLCGSTEGFRILKGTRVARGEIPWQVGLGEESQDLFKLFCGGTLISPKHVITSAHCIYFGSDRLAVFLGSVSRKSKSGITFDIERAKIHELFDKRTFYNDIALVTLMQGVELTKTMFPVCLPRKYIRETFTGKVLKISGWGSTSAGVKKYPTDLQKSDVRAIDNSLCGKVWGSKRIIPGMICTAHPTRDACKGDTGGPVTFTSDKVTYLVGVISYGKMCEYPLRPVINTRITHFMDWIDKNIGYAICSK